MGKRCCVPLCAPEKKCGRLFSVPFSHKDSSNIQKKDLSIRRRRLWLKRIKKSPESTDPTLSVCSKHFHSGKPSYPWDTSNPDWAPSLMLGEVSTSKANIERYLRRNKRSSMNHPQDADPKEKDQSTNNKSAWVDKNVIEENLHSYPLSKPLELLEVTPSLVEVTSKVAQECLALPIPSIEDAIINSLRGEIEILKKQLEKEQNALIELKREFHQHLQRPFSPRFFERCFNVDKLMGVYTSMSSAKAFRAVFTAISVGVKDHNNQALPNIQQFFLTLVKLTNNLSDEDLAFRFNINQSTVSRYFHKWINIVYIKLKNRVLIWPPLSVLKVAMPMCFRRHFPNTVSIIDCFETQIQIPNNHNDQAATYSRYKSRNTVKYLISATPHGTINFISKGYAGRSSDRYIVKDSGYIEKLLPGDEILADKGFDIAEDIGSKGATLTTPAFKRSIQLSQEETEFSRKVSNVRIHIERIIGCLRMRFDIMRGTVIMSNLNNYDESVCFYDKIVSVCCILANLNKSVVPFG